MSACRIKEFSSYINNSFATPFHNKTVCICNFCYHNGIQVFFLCSFNKTLNISFANNNSHSFLTFRDCKFSSIQTFIFFWNFIKVNFKTRSKFTNCNRNTTSSKIITATNHQAHFFIAEKPLNLSFFNSITFLNFSSSSCNRFFSMNF